jgi:trehalose/maltose hydrolase-like predicted phosphorylase
MTDPGAQADPDLAWRIEQEGFDPAREHAVESLFTLGNGYLGVRGALDAPLPVSQGDLFIAGVYDRKQPQRPYSEPEFLHIGNADYRFTELVSVPFPFRVQVMVEGERLDLANAGCRTHRRVLDLREGTLRSDTHFATNGGRLTMLRTRRCASAVDYHLLMQEVRVCFENHSGFFELDASLADPDLGLRHPHLVPLPVMDDTPGIEVHCYRTSASGYDICLAARTTRVGAGNDAVRWQGSGTIGETLIFRRYVVIYTSRDVADPAAAALQHLRAQRWEDFDRSWAAHVAGWDNHWQRGDVRVDGSPATEQALRFHVYHLVGTADHDAAVSVGARALSGRAYEGHVFWDVEIFMLPFYLHTCPDVARSLLCYRHHTLDGARRRARAQGYAGASYAWESTVTGDDVTPQKILLKTTGKQIPIFTGTEQIHVTADVAYGIWRYFDATHDNDFMRNTGAEILIETARFWASRCVRAGNGYHIRGVIGPDEYHHSVNDNAYTNWMARFNLEKAVWVLEWLRRENADAAATLGERLRLRPDEAVEWTAVASSLYCPQPNAHGVIEQFEGFFDLEDYPLTKEERFKAPVSRLFDWDKVNRLKLIKQADVLMLPHLFPDAFPREVIAANYRYYEPLTDHGSSLSPVIHAAIAARLGLHEDAQRYWRQSLWLDLSNAMDNSALGIHAACMGGTWQALVFGFLGVRFTDHGPIADPAAASRLPARWRAVAMQLAWRGRRYSITVERNEEG